MKRSCGIDADTLLVNCGLHDLRIMTETGEYNISIESYADNLRSIIETALSMKLTLIWIQTTPLNDKIHNESSAVEKMGFQRHLSDCIAYNKISESVMREAAVPIIDLYRFTLNLGTDLYCDHVHFYNHIREKQAAFIAGCLEEYEE